MKPEQDNYCYLFTLASTNKATQATLKIFYTTLFTQSICSISLIVFEITR